MCNKTLIYQILEIGRLNKKKYFKVFTYLNLALLSPIKTDAELQKSLEEAMQS